MGHDAERDLRSALQQLTKTVQPEMKNARSVVIDEPPVQCYRPACRSTRSLRRGRHMRFGKIALVAVLALVTMGPAAAQNNWGAFGQDPGATKFSTLTQINCGQRQEPQARVDVPHRRLVRVLRERAARHRRRDVLQRAQRRLRARCRDRRADLEVRDDRHRAPRTALLAGRQRRRARASFRRPTTGLAAIDPKTGTIDHELRQKGFITGPPHDVAAGRLQEHSGDAGRQLDRQGLGHRHRRAALDAAT